MYSPYLRRKRSGVPVLRREAIDAIAERMLMDYDPAVFTNPHPVDIDGFAQNYLKAHLNYEYLSNNGVYLGMTVFEDADRVVVYNKDTEEAEYISVKARSIIIDRELLEDEDQEGRYRFTVGHECGHVGLGHGLYFKRLPYPDAAARLNGNARAPIIICRSTGCTERSRDAGSWSDEDWMEWQADNFSSSLLLPKRAILKLKEMLEEGFDYPGSCCMPNLIDAVPKVFHVSREAAMIRLKQMGLVSDRFIPRKDIYLYL